jgi:hypothetical protein
MFKYFKYDELLEKQIISWGSVKEYSKGYYNSNNINNNLNNNNNISNNINNHVNNNNNK